MTISKGPAPGLVNHPDHVVRITTSDHRWTVRVGETVVATSTRALVVEETDYERVLYFPPEDVAAGQLTPIDRLTTCPFKGEAHYFAGANQESGPPLAWMYPSVYDEVSSIAGYIAFYEDQVEIVQETSEVE